MDKRLFREITKDENVASVWLWGIMRGTRRAGLFWVWKKGSGLDTGLIPLEHWREDDVSVNVFLTLDEYRAVQRFRSEHPAARRTILEP